MAGLAVTQDIWPSSQLGHDHIMYTLLAPITCCLSVIPHTCIYTYICMYIMDGSDRSLSAENNVYMPFTEAQSIYCSQHMCWEYWYMVLEPTYNLQGVLRPCDISTNFLQNIKYVSSIPYLDNYINYSRKGICKSFEKSMCYCSHNLFEKKTLVLQLSWLHAYGVFSWHS